MTWQEDLERIALLHVKYGIFVGWKGEARAGLKIPNRPKGETTEEETNVVAVDARAAGRAPEKGRAGDSGWRWEGRETFQRMADWEQLRQIHQGTAEPP